jgi:hypothetical protein
MSPKASARSTATRRGATDKDEALPVCTDRILRQERRRSRPDVVDFGKNRFQDGKNGKNRELANNVPGSAQVDRCNVVSSAAPRGFS